MQGQGNRVLNVIHDVTLLVREPPLHAAKDNDELELQDGRVYLHLGARRDESPRP
jgi:hypothetical protein